jgi:diguanylate cyclase (GGDEF)-like protein
MDQHKRKKPDSQSIRDEITLMNLKRVYFMALIAVPVNIAHIIIFSGNQAGDAIESFWRTGIIVSHCILAVTLSLLGIVSYLLKRKPRVHKLFDIVPYFAAITILLMCIVIVTLDQLVTVSITPFIVGCITVAVVFLFKPLIVLLLYGCAYTGYRVAIAFTQSDQAILLSNRVNGLTIVGMGIFLSILLWRAIITDLQNKRTIASQQKDLEQKNHVLEMLAFFDQLTGLYNRHRFDELLAQEIFLAQEHKQPLALIMVDIDHFKLFNDSYGHLAGDHSLKLVAKTLNEIAARTGGLMGRFGGEEFLVMLGNTSEESAAVIAEEMRKKVEDLHIENKGAGTLLTISLGVTATIPDTDVLPDNLIQASDKALYGAKQQGRNRVVKFSELPQT